METIQIEVSAELAERLRPHYDQLPQILEWGLRHVERNALLVSAVTRPPLAAQRDETLAALHATGILVELDPAITARYRSGAHQRRCTPVEVNGKPLSEIIIEERRQQWDGVQ